MTLGAQLGLSNGARPADSQSAVVLQIVNGEYQEDDDGIDEFRSVPHPDDRLWRHPSEIAAMAAAHAHAETAKVPVVHVPEVAPKSRLHLGLKVAAGVVVVGAAALTIGVMSNQRGLSTSSVISTNVTADAPEIEPARQDLSATSLAADVIPQGEEQLTTRVHDQVAASLPRIQAVTSGGMREGSGMFVTDDGHIATSAELIESAEYVLAWTDDGQRWKADLIASDTMSDVAVVKIDSDNWPAVSLGSTDAPWSGQYALALDHDHNAISIGEVTGVTAPSLIIDQQAAVPGSAIVDDTGAVIAMITGDGTNSHGTRAWMLEQVAIDLIASGQTSHNQLGLIVSDEPGSDMIVVNEVIANSPAAESGLQPGDLIDTFDGSPVIDSASLYHHVQQAQPGDPVVLTVTSEGDRRIVIVTIELAP